MKEIIKEGMVLREVRPGVYEGTDNGVTYRELYPGEIIKGRRQ